MQFYRINIILESDEDGVVAMMGERRIKSLTNREFINDLCRECEKYSDKISDMGYFFAGNVNPSECSFGLLIRGSLDVEKYVRDFAKAKKLESGSIDIRETTFSEFSQMLQGAARYGYIFNEYDVLREFELEELLNHGRRVPSFDYDEEIIREREQDAIYKSAQNYFTKESFIPELDRIFLNPLKKKIYGHPVDYMIESDDERTQKGMAKLLVQALYNVGRVDNRRYCSVEIEADMCFSKKIVEALYKSCAGGTMVLRFRGYEIDDDDVAHAEYGFLEELCSIIRHHCCDVLTIMCLPRECTNLRHNIFEHMANSTFVEIKEELAVDEKAVEYLKKRAKEYKVFVDKRLLCQVEAGRGYLIPELNKIFDEWYSHKLKTSIFSQYKDVAGVKSEVKKSKPNGTAYKELESMIGLNSAKEVINQALDSYKAKIVFKDKGMRDESVCNHMIFTGNPGTAKTTVARLFARILKDNEVLSRGHIVEVGRGDLVGQYVGWTAPTIKKKFKQASGGVLFIDEAYSLVDDRNGSFGDEAINTIVQEMENHRDDVIVIFAGYPDKMEGFLNKNPGLRSRIAHHVHFEDYDTDELCRIADHIAHEKGLILEEKARSKIKDIMEVSRKQADFGNGRFVRNVIEKARMAQSSRLIRMDFDDVTPEDIKKICAEDIELPKTPSSTPSFKIGFAAS